MSHVMAVTQGLVSCTSRVQKLLLQSQPDPSMAGALPPGAWWEAKPSSKNGNQPPAVRFLLTGPVACMSYACQPPSGPMLYVTAGTV